MTCAHRNRDSAERQGFARSLLPPATKRGIIAMDRGALAPQEAGIAASASSGDNLVVTA
ncbi:hypothetical protein LX88_007807 [Lentzea californiensis]|nr:hypothetical protein [Lentzea californiensis]